MEYQDHHQPDPAAPSHAEGVQASSRGCPRSGTPGEPPISDSSFARGAQRPEGEPESTPPPRDILATLAGIDLVNSTLAAHKLEASKALLEMALDKDHDPAERRKCATAIMRAPFQRYPSAAAINGPTPPKSKRRKNDDDDPDNNGGDDDGGDDQPPTPPEDLMHAYDHGYWNGYATRHWPKPTIDTIEEALEPYAAHAPGRTEPLQSDNLPELPSTHRHPSATDRRFPRRSVRTHSVAAVCPSLRRSVRTPRRFLRPSVRTTHHLPLPRPSLPESTPSGTRRHGPWGCGVGGGKGRGLPRRRLRPYDCCSGVARAPPR